MESLQPEILRLLSDGHLASAEAERLAPIAQFALPNHSIGNGRETMRWTM